MSDVNQIVEVKGIKRFYVILVTLRRTLFLVKTRVKILTCTVDAKWYQEKFK